MGHMVRPVLFHHIGDHLVPALVAEVDVKIRHAHPLRAEEALEDQVVPDRVHIGDAQAVGGQAGRAGAPPRAHGDARAFCVADEIPHDEVIVHIAHLGDGAHLVVQPVPELRAGAVPIAGPQALSAEALKELLVGGSVRGIETGQLGLAELELHLAALRNPDGVVRRLRAVGEEAAHFLLGFKVELFCGKVQPALVLDGAAGLDAHEHLVHLLVRGADVVAVVGDHQGDSRLLRQL